MPHVELPQAEFKVVLLGDSNTGKTSLVLRFVEGSYRDNRSATIGAFFLTKRLTLDSMTCKLLLWDTAGQEQFQRLALTYYKQAAAAIVCVDLTGDSMEQADRLRRWLEQVLHNTQNQRIVLLVAGCKCDLVPTPGLEDEVKAVAERLGAAYIRTSAKNDINVTEVFRSAASAVLHCQQESSLGRGRPIPVTLGGGSSRQPINRSFSPTDRNGSGRNLTTRTTTNSTTTNKVAPQQQRNETSQKIDAGQGHDNSTAGDSDDHVLEPDDGTSMSSGPKIMCDNGILICASSGGSPSECSIL